MSAENAAEELPTPLEVCLRVPDDVTVRAVALSAWRCLRASADEPWLVWPAYLFFIVPLSVYILHDVNDARWRLATTVAQWYTLYTVLNFFIFGVAALYFTVQIVNGDHKEAAAAFVAVILNLYGVAKIVRGGRTIRMLTALASSFHLKGPWGDKRAWGGSLTRMLSSHFMDDDIPGQGPRLKWIALIFRAMLCMARRTRLYQCAFVHQQGRYIMDLHLFAMIVTTWAWRCLGDDEGYRGLPARENNSLDPCVSLHWVVEALDQGTALSLALIHGDEFNGAAKLISEPSIVQKLRSLQMQSALFTNTSPRKSRTPGHWHANPTDADAPVPPPPPSSQMKTASLHFVLAHLPETCRSVQLAMTLMMGEGKMEYGNLRLLDDKSYAGFLRVYNNEVRDGNWLEDLSRQAAHSILSSLMAGVAVNFVRGPLLWMQGLCVWMLRCCTCGCWRMRGVGWWRARAGALRFHPRFQPAVFARCALQECKRFWSAPVKKQQRPKPESAQSIQGVYEVRVSRADSADGGANHRLAEFPSVDAASTASLGWPTPRNVNSLPWSRPSVTSGPLTARSGRGAAGDVDSVRNSSATMGLWIPPTTREWSVEEGRPLGSGSSESQQRPVTPVPTPSMLSIHSDVACDLDAHGNKRFYRRKKGRRNVGHDAADMYSGWADADDRDEEDVGDRVLQEVPALVAAYVSSVVSVMVFSALAAGDETGPLQVMPRRKYHPESSDRLMFIGLVDMYQQLSRVCVPTNRLSRRQARQRRAARSAWSGVTHDTWDDDLGPRAIHAIEWHCSLILEVGTRLVLELEARGGSWQDALARVVRLPESSRALVKHQEGVEAILRVFVDTARELLQVGNKPPSRWLFAEKEDDDQWRRPQRVGILLALNFSCLLCGFRSMALWKADRACTQEAPKPGGHAHTAGKRRRSSAREASWTELPEAWQLPGIAAVTALHHVLFQLRTKLANRLPTAGGDTGWGVVWMCHDEDNGHVPELIFKGRVAPKVETEGPPGRSGYLVPAASATSRTPTRHSSFSMGSGLPPAQEEDGSELYPEAAAEWLQSDRGREAVASAASLAAAVAAPVSAEFVSGMAHADAASSLSLSDPEVLSHLYTECGLRLNEELYKVYFNLYSLGSDLADRIDASQRSSRQRRKHARRTANEAQRPDRAPAEPAELQATAGMSTAIDSTCSVHGPWRPVAGHSAAHQHAPHYPECPPQSQYPQYTQYPVTDSIDLDDDADSDGTGSLDMPGPPPEVSVRLFE